MSDIRDTLLQLFGEYGDSLLDNPLRLEAFLRDLHHDQPREISCLMETIHSGVLEYINTETPRDCQLMLAQKSGLTPVSAEWAIGVWFSLWKENVLRLEHKELNRENQNKWTGSLEEVLGPFRAGGKKI